MGHKSSKIYIETNIVPQCKYETHINLKIKKHINEVNKYINKLSDKYYFDIITRLIYLNKFTILINHKLMIFKNIIDFLYYLVPKIKDCFILYKNYKYFVYQSDYKLKLIFQLPIELEFEFNKLDYLFEDINNYILRNLFNIIIKTEFSLNDDSFFPILKPTINTSNIYSDIKEKAEIYNNIVYIFKKYIII